MRGCKDSGYEMMGEMSWITNKNLYIPILPLTKTYPVAFNLLSQIPFSGLKAAVNPVSP